MITWTTISERVRHGNPPPPARVDKDDASWLELLAPDVFRVTRGGATERAFSSAMCTSVEPGRYHCACCDTLLFDATSKFDSGSGWPSFTQPAAPDVVAYHGDDSHGMSRVEATCAVCDAHLGHVFPDGPGPSRLRYCMNAAALRKATA